MFNKVKYLIPVALFFLSNGALINFIAQTGNWEGVGDFKDIAVNSIEVNNEGIMFAGTYAGVYRSTDKGLTWNPINQGLTDTNVNVIAINSSNEIFAGTYGGIFFSGNNGTSWQKQNNGLRLKKVRNLIIDEDDRIFAGSSDSATGVSGSIFLSRNSGETWIEIDSGLFGEDNIKDFVIDNDNKLYAAGNGGGIIQSEFFYGWNEQVQKWEQVFRFAPSIEVMRLCGTEGGLILAGEAHGMMRTSDKGMNWEPADLYPRAVLSIAAVSDSVLYAGTFHYGIFRSIDTGNTWEPFGLSGRNIIELTIGREGHLFAGTEEEGMFRSVDRVTSAKKSKDDNSTPNKFTLNQNYPNPFNPQTTIQYSVPETAKVIVTVFDALGNEVAEIVNKKHAPGDYSIGFDGKELPSGIYIYQMKTDEFTSAKKMILLR